jgi:molybdate transport system substrate-binding protein
MTRRMRCNPEGSQRFPGRSPQLLGATYVSRIPGTGCAPAGLRRWFVFLFLSASTTAFASDKTVHAAVAANFVGPLKKIAADFERDHPVRVVISSGATGKFYAQIRSGAPFDVLLAADDQTPRRLEAEGYGVRGSRFTYAIGQLALWTAKPNVVVNEQTLRALGMAQSAKGKLAIANPKVAPYGRAAIEVLRYMKLEEHISPRFVQGESIAQAYQFVATGNAAYGFVALSQISDAGGVSKGAAWIVPSTMHQPIRQDAVLLKHGSLNAEASQFLQYLRSEPAQRTIRGYGYVLAQ